MKILTKLSQIAILSIISAFLIGCGGGDSNYKNNHKLIFDQILGKWSLVIDFNDNHRLEAERLKNGCINLSDGTSSLSIFEFSKNNILKEYYELYSEYGCNKDDFTGIKYLKVGKYLIGKSTVGAKGEGAYELDLNISSPYIYTMFYIKDNRLYLALTSSINDGLSKEHRSNKFTKNYFFVKRNY